MIALAAPAETAESRNGSGFPRLRRPDMESI
jgi:hypothetical protein